MRTLVEYLVKSLADHPEEVELQEEDTDDTLVLRVKIAENDIGKIIGKNGSTINAIRTIVQAAASSHKKKAKLEVLN
jgi:predicted RNA-binding protein YlqC (UPF0109 family)